MTSLHEWQRHLNPSESGKCPHCKTMGLLNYGEMECDGGDGLFYPFECGDCGCEGREWNVVKFDGMEITKKGDTLTKRFWDCECVSGYIHPKDQLKCQKCGAKAKDQPDSHINEVRDAMEQEWKEEQQQEDWDNAH